ncbi:MAG TPA: hypothetical protein VFP36_05500, partial [Usitatibacter sp.]|nr:hypothetical protein [Usitatibacter sp.]
MLSKPLRILRAALAGATLAALAAHAAAPSAAPAPAPSQDDTAHFQQLVEAAGAVVGIKVRAISNARSAETLGAERSGSGVVFAPD